MKIIATSDWHGFLPELPPCDLLLVVGDIAPDDRPFSFGRKPTGQQIAWIRNEFVPHVQGIARQTIFVWGNHDFVGEDDNVRDILPPDVVLLQDAAFEWRGLQFYGTPWVPNLPNWAFHATEEEIGSRLAASCPEKLDFLLSHGPPFQAQDQVRSGDHVGSRALRTWVDQFQPACLVCGHIHEDFGELQLGETLVCNVSFVDERYEPRNRFKVFEV